MNDDDLADAIRDTLISPNCSDSNMEPANVVDGLYAVAQSIGRGLKLLGNADASTPQGGLEAHGAAIIEGAEKIARSLENIALSISRLTKAIAAIKGK